MRAIIIGLALLGATANAKQDYKLFYSTPSGKQMTAEQAVLASAKGETIYKCQTTELGISKSGTSISLKATKKPKQ